MTLVPSASIGPIQIGVSCPATEGVAAPYELLLGRRRSAQAGLGQGAGSKHMVLEADTQISAAHLADRRGTRVMPSLSCHRHPHRRLPRTV
ncbi:hypothetical protein ACFYYB_27180 [Streptomyces sp. NPDC002886]|uniref:hypothetical protein n=1 Tax=Streptomyces sp. NPDC002886 TaxID=3364667 RepID=UPI0036A095C3